MTNYTGLIISLENEFGFNSVLEHQDDPRVIKFRKKLQIPDNDIHPAILKVIQYELDYGEFNLDEIAERNIISQQKLLNLIVSDDLSIERWMSKNKQFKEAQHFLDSGNKVGLTETLKMPQRVVSFLCKYGFLNDAKCFKKRRVTRIEYDHFKAQNLLDIGMKKRQIAKEIGITVDELAREIRKGELSEINWLKWHLGIYKR
ncbi:hypothetical protein [Lactobacillus terrae]|uniref:hypothetical protein n=1 Tax=Lactobacillus terrae TaxID=2269374 RepID=UPI000C1B75E0|nr:hypothetical protein [Lactobacillus terrae]